jgi:hypothetical protein
MWLISSSFKINQLEIKVEINSVKLLTLGEKFYTTTKFLAFLQTAAEKKF